MDFQELANLPSKCIYGLFNDLDKKVYIGHTNNLLRSLYSNIESLKYSNIDFNKLDFRIIETIVDSARLRIRYQYWVSDYSNRGWTMYRNYKAISYRVKVEVLNDVTKVNGKKYYFYVKLVSRGYKELIVGVFDAIDECNEFVSLNYSNICDIVYSDNELTNLYRKSCGK